MRKISLKDILKLGADLTSHTIKDDEATRQMIADVKKRQQEIIDNAKVDWNNPNLRRPMDF